MPKSDNVCRLLAVTTKYLLIVIIPLSGSLSNILILISNAASLAVIALIGADYVSDLLYGQPSGNLFNIVVASTTVGLFYGVNLLGLRTSSRTQNFLMIVKIALILLLISTFFTGIHENRTATTMAWCIKRQNMVLRFFCL